ncbi:GTP cyclohydrolase I [Paenibacillus curdlanolyticus YK9]|uniref:GTP cyclohydrolase 1 n=1 Tax=Paenibacillus curdlanolyticus YK9 TaxID=717606 RepID=E0I7E6_9BACL|nr:GTP cyclohydrolase I FolE [Paenibacillus curdlanolyticus]EFM11962.1 GTP cyclohydrolase I [Paenibacillus curdlanolyticus YK9]
MASKEYRNIQAAENREQIEAHIRSILRLIGEDADREGLLETPARVARMYEEIFSGYVADYHEVLGVLFDENHEELVIVKDIDYFSQCEHHMVPFMGKVHIGYVPSGKVAGLSKFARLVEAVSKKLQLQERMTTEISGVIMDVLAPKGVMVVVTGQHLCMCGRGVKKSGAVTVTSATRGEFRHNYALRNEFMALIQS